MKVALTLILLTFACQAFSQNLFHPDEAQSASDTDYSDNLGAIRIPRTDLFGHPIHEDLNVICDIDGPYGDGSQSRLHPFYKLIDGARLPFTFIHIAQGGITRPYHLNVDSYSHHLTITDSKGVVLIPIFFGKIIDEPNEFNVIPKSLFPVSNH